MNLQLRPPEPPDEQEFLRAYEATKVSDPKFTHFYAPGMPYGEWLAILEKKRLGVGQEPGHGHGHGHGRGKSLFLLAWADDQIVGRVTLRDSLPEPLLSQRGHIGYVVLPAFRRRGYATEMLKLALPIAKSLGLNRARLTCDPANTGSRKTIEGCGGVFEETIEFEEGSGLRTLNAYWIELG